MRRTLLAAVVAVLALTGCGGGTSDKDVIRAWADALRAGQFAQADRLFALPVRVRNGGRVMQFDARWEVDYFNRTLPCGAILRSTRPAAGGRLVATFELTERQGPGAGCGPGTGQSAQVTFLVRDGRIVEWLRAVTPEPSGQIT